MPIHNADIAAAFGEIADLLEIQGANPFRIRAYRNAARSVGEFGRDFSTLIASGEAIFPTCQALAPTWPPRFAKLQ